MKSFLSGLLILAGTLIADAQSLRWQNVDQEFGPLPASVHVYKTTDSLDGKPNLAFYVIADLQDKQLLFTADTTENRRFTPSQFFHKNGQPLLVVNCTFFSFETNRNLNVVIRDQKPLAFNISSVKTRAADSVSTETKVFRSALGISRKRKADVAWIRNDSSGRVEASQVPVTENNGQLFTVSGDSKKPLRNKSFRKWKMQTAIGGGPVLLQDGRLMITNNEERMFAGAAIRDKHPRTAIGYTADRKLVILVIQGRFPGLAEGATLVQEAQMLMDLGCVEALNLDGGGSSCLLVNGKETITPSDKGQQRPVPAVFLLDKKRP